MNNIELLLDSARGRYIPQNFAEECNADYFEGIDLEDFRTIKKGPSEEWYWDAWTSILDRATYNEDGKIWSLYQEDDLFLVAWDSLTDEEYKNFTGEDRA